MQRQMPILHCIAAILHTWLIYSSLTPGTRPPPWPRTPSWPDASWSASPSPAPWRGSSRTSAARRSACPVWTQWTLYLRVLWLTSCFQCKCGPVVKTFLTCEWSSDSWVPAPWRGWTPLCCACSGRTGGRGWRRACRPPRGPRSSWSPGSWSQPPAPRVWKLNILIVYKYWLC